MFSRSQYCPDLFPTYLEFMLKRHKTPAIGESIKGLRMDIGRIIYDSMEEEVLDSTTAAKRLAVEAMERNLKAVKQR
jgi:hypothetical protein